MKSILSLAVFFFLSTTANAAPKMIIEYFNGKLDFSASIGPTLPRHTMWPGPRGPIIKPESECYVSITTSLNGSRLVWLGSNLSPSLAVTNLGLDKGFLKGWDGNLNSALLTFNGDLTPSTFIIKRKHDDGTMGNSHTVFSRKCTDLKFDSRIER
ncbi:MAG TPA: hypothetical protein VNJ08_09535 [Bacteriovoracaceae bacterium]|nr:hypothetical protein [Bacteriovoracaceae bacterium]